MENYKVRDLTRQVASTVRAAMAKFNVTQAEMAAAVGVSQSQLSKMVRGTRPIDIDQLDAMCRALGLDTGTVVADAEAFLGNYDIAPAARFVYVEEGVRLATPYELPQDEPALVLPATRRRDVAPEPDTEDLFTVDLKDDFELAASDDDTAIDPERGKA